MNEYSDPSGLPGSGIAIEIIGSMLFLGIPVALLVMVITTIHAFARAAKQARSRNVDYKVITTGAQLTWWLSATIVALALFAIFATNFFFDAGYGIQQ